MDFAALPLSAPLLQVLQELGFQTATPIQAQTGSGKRAAFALPILEKIQLQQRRLQALVLCPTRELSEVPRREPQRPAAWIDSYAGARLTPAVGKSRRSSIARTPLPAFTYANTRRLPPHLSNSAQSSRGLLQRLRSPGPEPQPLLGITLAAC